MELKSMPKINKKIEQTVEQPENISIADLYKTLVAKTVDKKTSSVPSADVYKHLNELFDESGQEQLMFAPAQRVVKTMMGSTEKNFYNRVKSAVEAKNSPFETFSGEGGHVYVRRKVASP
jgi:hypothetical protein